MITWSFVFYPWLCFIMYISTVSQLVSMLTTCSYWPTPISFQELSVMDDTVLQTHRVNPKLIQVILLANGRPFIKTICYAWIASCTVHAYIVNESQTLKHSVNIKWEVLKKCQMREGEVMSEHEVSLFALWNLRLKSFFHIPYYCNFSLHV